MTQRLREAPITVLLTALFYLALGGLLAVAAVATAVAPGRAEISQLLAMAAGVGLAATGMGIAVGSRWARTMGLIGALVLIAASIFLILFVTLMSIGVGIPLSDPLALQPIAVFILVIALAISSIVVLIRHSDWFGPTTWTGADGVASGAERRDLNGRSWRLVPIVAVALQLLLAVPYIGLTVLEVPRPLFFVFWAVWAGMFVVALIFAMRRPRLTILVPVASAALYAVAMWVGRVMFGWAP